MASLLQMLQALIASPSISSTLPHLDQSNRAVIELLAQWLGDLGFAIEILPLSQNKFNLIATLGAGPGGLVLSGHTDTVPCDEKSWQFNPFKLTQAENKFYGLGTADMKAFFALAIEAAKALQNTALKQPLIILATADEESSMSGARALMQQGKLKARYAVIGEPTGLKPIRMHKGIGMYKLDIQGHGGHSSDPALGINSIEVMQDAIQLLLKWRTELQLRHQNPLFAVSVPTLNLGCINGGDNPNRICSHCQLQFDLRILPRMDIHSLEAELQQRLQPLQQKWQVKFSLVPLFPALPPFETAANSVLVQTVEQLTGHSASSVAFGTEAPFLTQLGMETLIIGPGNIEQAHQPDEYLEMTKIQPTLDLLTQLIHQFCL